jgi:hypothetical protein
MGALLGIVFMYRMIRRSESATLDEDGLPLRDESEIAAMFAAMPRRWVEYPGRAPALSLEVRGLSHELYCRVASKHFARATDEPTPAVVADAFYRRSCWGRRRPLLATCRTPRSRQAREDDRRRDRLHTRLCQIGSPCLR